MACDSHGRTEENQKFSVRRAFNAAEILTAFQIHVRSSTATVSCCIKIVNVIRKFGYGKMCH
jgi:hypothetical protein